MRQNQFVSALLAAALVGWGMAGSGSVASAADLKLKAPPPPPVESLDIHGFADIAFLNDYIPPRGLLVATSAWSLPAPGSASEWAHRPADRQHVSRVVIGTGLDARLSNLTGPRKLGAA